MKRTNRYLIALSTVLLFFTGIAVLLWYPRELSLSDVLGIESTKIVTASICDANDCMNTEVQLNSEQIENIIDVFSQTQIKKIHGGSSIQNAYARFFFETSDSERYELLCASNEILINRLNKAEWYVYNITTPNDELKFVMMNLFS